MALFRGHHGRDALRRLSIVLLIAIVLSALLIMPGRALAHSEVIRSDPASGAVLDSAPTQLKLYFTEDVGLEFSSAILLDRARKEYTIGGLAHDGADTASLLVPIDQSLPNGSYTLVWRVVSGIDGHLTLGTLPFHVGPVDPNEAPAEIIQPEDLGSVEYSISSENPDPFRWAVRAVILAAAILLLGGSVFTVLVVEPAASDFGQPGEVLWRSSGVRFAGIAASVAAVLLIGLAFDLVAQVALVTNTDFLGALGKGDTISLLLNSTRFGFAWIMKVLAAALLLVLMILVWAFNRRGGSSLWEIGIAAGSLLLLAESLSSHAAAAVNYGQLLGLPIPLVSDWLHLVTVGTWVGGLGYMMLVLFPTFRKLNYTTETRRTFLGKSIPRFSRLAIASVAILGITGTYNLIIHTVDIGAIVTSTYGQVVLIKVVLFLALIGLGAINLRRLSPSLQASAAGRNSEQGTTLEAKANSGPVTGLWRNIRIEVALASLALVCAGGLTLLPPPNTGVAQSPLAPVVNPTQAPPPDIASLAQTVGGYAVTLLARTGEAGDELTLDILRSDPASAPLTDVTTVLLRVTPQDLEAGSTAFESTPVGALEPNTGAWKADGALFPLDGQYIVNATFRRTQTDDLRVAYAVTVAEGKTPVLSVTTALQARVITDPSPPVAGTVSLVINILDGENRPIEGANLSVSARRTTAQETPVVAAGIPVAGTPGAFRASLDLGAPGAWLLLFTVEREGQPTLRSDASIDVAPSNP